VQLELTEDLGVPGDLRSGISGSIRAFKRLSEGVAFFPGENQFQTDGQFHKVDNIKNSRCKKKYLSCLRTIPNSSAA
jgi:hypothetical protein